MKRLFLLVPILALVAAPARSDDPTTNAPLPEATTNSAATVQSPIVTRGIISSRGKAFVSYGPRETSHTAELRAKRWLKSLQRADGSWPEPSAATTALALLVHVSSRDDAFNGEESEKSHESVYVDSRGNRCALGWWDSPSAEEFHFCDGGPVLPCSHWKDGVRVDGTTTLGARIQDTCLMLIPNLPMMHHYPRLCRETRLRPDIRFPPALGGSERYWRPDDAGLAARPRRGRVLRVGPGGDFAKPSEAAAAARDGDTVRIAPGTWTGDVCVWPQNDLAIFGAGAEATILDADGRAAAGKGLWVVQGTNVVVRGVTLRGAACPDRNGAGIRHEANGAFEATDCRFEGNENGFLSGVATNAVLTFRRCVFRDNGAGDGQSHNVYVGRAKKLVFEDCLSDHAREGHALKSRALVTIVDRCLFDDGDDGRSSYLVDCPDGGLVRFYWSRLVQSPVAPNGTMVSVGEESVLPDSSFGKDWTFFENRRASGTEVRSFVPEAKDAWRRDR